MITDWAGNEINPGMEVAFLQTVIHHWEGGILWPNRYVDGGKPAYEKIQDAHDELCWILGKWMVVQKSVDDGRLYVVDSIKDSGYTFSTNVYLVEKKRICRQPAGISYKRSIRY